MATNTGRLKALRAQALHAERNAGKKISRNRGKSIELGGSEYDPRTGAGNINNMGIRGLTSHLKHLAVFNSRATQFVAGAKGAIIPKAMFDKYKTAENAYNARANEENASFNDIKLPSGTTIGARHAKMKADHPMMGNPSVNVPNQPIVSSPGDFTSVKAVEKLYKDLKRKMTKKYDREQLKRSKAELQRIMDVLKQPENDARISKLTNRQFNLLWNHSQFATAASLQYEIIQARARGVNEPWFEQQMQSSFDVASNLIKWASEQ